MYEKLFLGLFVWICPDVVLCKNFDFLLHMKLNKAVEMERDDPGCLYHGLNSY